MVEEIRKRRWGIFEMRKLLTREEQSTGERPVLEAVMSINPAGSRSDQ